MSRLPWSKPNSVNSAFIKLRRAKMNDAIVNMESVRRTIAIEKSTLEQLTTVDNCTAEVSLRTIMFALEIIDSIDRQTQIAISVCQTAMDAGPDEN